MLVSAKFLSLCFGALVVILLFSATLVFDDLPYDYKTLSETLSAWRAKNLPIHDQTYDHAPVLGTSVYDFFDQVYNVKEPPHMQLSALESECRSSQWQSNLYFECILMQGGLTTLMSQVKTCLHMAIELGANLIMPTTPVRGAEDLVSWDENNRKPLGLWFDRDFLISRLTAACPNMKVATLNDKQEPELFIGMRVEMDYGKAPFRWGFGPYETPETPWKSWFLDTVEAATTELANKQDNIVLRAGTPSQFFNVTDDVRHNQRAWFELSHLMRARPIPREIIGKILETFSDDAGRRIPFLGVHFRAEDDVNDSAFWTPIEKQISRIWETVEEVRRVYRYPAAVPKMIYLACGDAAQVANFKAGAADHGWQVVDKWSIAQSISAEAVQMIDDLDFDHEAMIDMGVLAISDFFVGLGASAFSFTIAHSRSPTGRYLGSSLDTEDIDPESEVYKARTHLYTDGGFAYQCCL